MNKNIELNSIIQKEKINADSSGKNIQQMETISIKEIKEIKLDNNKKNELLELKDFELNSLEYEEAIKYDKSKIIKTNRN